LPSARFERHRLRAIKDIPKVASLGGFHRQRALLRLTIVIDPARRASATIHATTTAPSRLSPLRFLQLLIFARDFRLHHHPPGFWCDNIISRRPSLDMNTF